MHYQMMTARRIAIMGYIIRCYDIIEEIPYRRVRGRASSVIGAAGLDEHERMTHSSETRGRAR